MAFPRDLVVAGIAIAKTLTAGLQADITHEAWTGQDGEGTATYAAPVTLQAVVDLTRKQKTTSSGRLALVIATVTIIGDVTPNGAAGRLEPIDIRDRITLPDGSTAPILEAPGAVLDPITGRGLINDITLGELL